MNLKKLDIKKIKNKLNTKFLAQDIRYHEEIPTTQDEIKRLVKKGEAQNGTYVVTDKQTNGQGTKGRGWSDGQYENICGSFVLIPNCDISKIKNITVVMAECIIEAVEKLYKIKLDIKYPNDVFCNGKKMAGILTESVSKGDIVQYIYVGIGIDINQTRFEKKVENIATSLKKEYKRDFDREELIAEFFNIFEVKYIEMIK